MGRREPAETIKGRSAAVAFATTADPRRKAGRAVPSRVIEPFFPDQRIVTNARPAGYSALQILLHWFIAALVAFQLLFGESMGEVEEAAERGSSVSGEDQWLADAHYWVGIVILLAAALRLFIRLSRGAPAPVDTGWSARLANLAHAAFYVLLIAMPITGLMAVYVSEEIGEFHSIGKPVFIILIILHVVGAVYHQLTSDKGVMKRMMSPAN